MSTLINVQWQSGLFDHLLRLPLAFFERRKLGDIQSRFDSLDTLRATFTTSVIGFIMDSIMVVGVCVMMLLYGGYLTDSSLLYHNLHFYSSGDIRQLPTDIRRMSCQEARAASYFMETLYGIATVKIEGDGRNSGAHWLNMKIDAINSGIKLTRWICSSEE